MTITQVITTLPTAPDPATDTRDQFSTKAAASVLAQKAMVPELNTWAGQVNAIAATSVGDVATAIGAATADTPVGTDEFAWRKTATGLLKKVTFTNALAWFAAVAGSAAQNFATNTLTASGGVKSISASALIGYDTGAGGVVTQLTSKSTTVTLNKPSGQITMHNASLAAGETVSFTFLNSAMIATSFLGVSVNASIPGNLPNYHVNHAVGAGGGYIHVTNDSAGALAEALVLNFVIVGGATS